MRVTSVELTKLDPGDNALLALINKMAPALNRKPPPTRVRAIIKCDTKADADAWQAFLLRDDVQAIFHHGEATTDAVGDPQEALIRRWGNDVHVIVQDVGTGEPGQYADPTGEAN